MQAQADLLPVRQRQPPRPRFPPVRALLPPPTVPLQLVHLPLITADLPAYLPQCQAPRPQPQRQTDLLCTQMCRHTRILPA